MTSYFIYLVFTLSSFLLVFLSYNGDGSVLYFTGNRGKVRDGEGGKSFH